MAAMRRRKSTIGVYDPVTSVVNMNTTKLFFWILHSLSLSLSLFLHRYITHIDGFWTIRKEKGTVWVERIQSVTSHFSPLSFLLSYNTLCYVWKPKRNVTHPHMYTHTHTHTHTRQQVETRKWLHYSFVTVHVLHWVTCAPQVLPCKAVHGCMRGH